MWKTYGYIMGNLHVSTNYVGFPDMCIEIQIWH